MFIYAADLHLRPLIWSKHPQIYGDTYMGWTGLVRMVIANPGATLILGGDIFNDKNPSGETEYVFKKGMDILKEKGHAVYFIEGNHDEEAVPRASLFGAIQLMDGEAVEINGYKIAGINYIRNNEKLQEALADAPVCDYLIMHTAFRNMLGFEDMWQCSIEDIPEQVGAVLAGHIHVPHLSEKLYSPGSLTVNNVAEFGENLHGYLKATKGGVTWHPLKGRTFLNVDIKDIKKETLDRLSKEALMPVVNLSFEDTYSEEAEEIIKMYPKVYFLKNAYSDMISELLGTSDVGELNIQEVIDEAILEYFEDSNKRWFAKNLIEAEVPADYLQNYMEET